MYEGLDALAERAREHNLHFWFCWTDDFEPLLTDEYGSPLIGKGYAEIDEGDFARLLNRLDGVEDDEQTNTPSQVTNHD